MGRVAIRLGGDRDNHDDNNDDDYDDYDDNCHRQGENQAERWL